MKSTKTFLTYVLAVCTIYISVTNVIGISELDADTNQTPNLSFGTTVDAALQITLRDGTNLYGRRTIFSGSGVEFGRVTFTNPGLVGNGDAYIDDNRLFLEAILDIGISFSGLLSAAVDLSKVAGAPNSFKSSLFSLSKNRSELAVEVLTEPRANRLATINSPTTFPIRFVFEVSPQQSGNIADRFRIIASSQ